ncbi:outer membrane immunogenic protein [Paracoccus laeviglucosivorans]|uniref:Outer membrane immunogenic protein n=2 Tax=Paracoccus laeviglucosivorans TaxID=1197861 RepID=A0A521DY27_9RHOB|nr:outer membrane immunogenic protein [Paracoccus laeviglucosivorans]
MKIKTIALVAGSLSLGATAAANAGGFVPPVMDSAPIVAEVEAPVGAWQGGYAGLTLGYAFKGDDRVGLTDSASNTFLGDIGEAELKGANAGIRAGYRWQRGNWVFGPEVGIEGGDIKGDTSGTLLGTDLEAEGKVNHMVALRFKTGYTVRPDMLVYGIAGVGRVDMDYELNGIEDSFSKTGYILGLGVEKQINEKWSVTGEYEYANFGKEDLQFGGLDTEATPKYNNLKVGVNFRF